MILEYDYPGVTVVLTVLLLGFSVQKCEQVKTDK